MTASHFAWDVLTSFLGAAFLVLLVVAGMGIADRRRTRPGGPR